MITQFGVRNYKALRDVSIDLTPIHVLIGPNDAGKTSIMEAMAALVRSLDRPLVDAFRGRWSGTELVWHASVEPVVEFCVDFETLDHTAGKYELALRFKHDGREVRPVRECLLFDGTDVLPEQEKSEGRPTSLVYYRKLAEQSSNSDAIERHVRSLAEAIGGVQYYGWDPRLLALPVALPAATNKSGGPPMTFGGFGLVMCLDDILGYDRAAFVRLEDEYRRFFPHIRSIKLKRCPGYRWAADHDEYVNDAAMLRDEGGKGIYFEMEGGYDLPARQVSDGMLVVLAYLALMHLPEPSRPRLLLLEEPENGIHHKRLKEIIAFLRHCSKDGHSTQVILSTHSPDVLDFFQPEEVTLCLRDGDGAIRTKRLSQSEIVQQRKDIFSLGEIWTAESDDVLASSPEPTGNTDP
jgi:energy-coupling factor transporter ATP-binding protein EcfA2